MTTNGAAHLRLKTPTLDLDALERDDAPEPFRAVIGGEEFVFGDVDDLDWKDATALHPEDAEPLLRALLGDDFDRFNSKPLPLWKLQALSNALDEHYGWSKRFGALGPGA